MLVSHSDFILYSILPKVIQSFSLANQSCLQNKLTQTSKSGFCLSYPDTSKMKESTEAIRTVIKPSSLFYGKCCGWILIWAKMWKITLIPKHTFTTHIMRCADSLWANKFTRHFTSVLSGSALQQEFRKEELMLGSDHKVKDGERGEGWEVGGGRERRQG